MKCLSLLFAILFSLSIQFAHAQSYIIQLESEGAGHWQYANLDGEIIIDAKHPNYNAFSEDGIAVIGYPKQNKYLLINTKGEEIDTEIKDFYLKDAMGYGVKGYSSGLIIMRIDDEYGCFDTDGKIVFPAIYDNILLFNQGYTSARIDKNFYILNNNGKALQITNKEIVDVKKFREGLAICVNKKGDKGFIDITGNIVIPCIYHGAGNFSGGLAWARTSDGRIGFINPKGEWVIEPKFSGAKDFDDKSGMAKVKYKRDWLYVSTSGEIKSFNISSTVYKFSEGLAKGKVESLFGFYNNQGEWVIEPKFEAVRDFKNGFAAVRINDRWGIIDNKGNWVLEPKYVGMRDVTKLK